MERTDSWPQDRAESRDFRRGFWLTSLIVGTSLLVWLTIIGSVLVAVALNNASGN